jgi:3-deoxy-manno-octulosonate cytidylyltransferase (CMP-KDO synthetase)
LHSELLLTLIVIPVRYGSTRFPGKPLAKLAGKPMIQHVYERATRVRSAKRIIVATDDSRIASEVKGFGGEVMLTSSRHESGTDRVGEVARRVRSEWVVNLQGDLPFVEPAMVDKVIRKMRSSKTLARMGTVCTPIRSYEALVDPNVVKVVLDRQGRALYFSRSPIPYTMGNGAAESASPAKQHLGLYIYKRDFLLELSRMPIGRLERAERLEQLRVLELGHDIQVVEWPRGTVEVNTPADLRKAKRYMKAGIS